MIRLSPLLLLLVSFVTQAQTPVNLHRIEAELDRIEVRLKQNSIQTSHEAGSAINEITDLRGSLNLCIERSKRELDRLKAVGVLPADTAEGASADSASGNINDDADRVVSDAKKRLSQCSVLLAEANGFYEQMARISQQKMGEHLVKRKESGWSYITGLFAADSLNLKSISPGRLFTSIRSEDWLLVLIAAAVGWFAGRTIRPNVRRGTALNDDIDFYHTTVKVAFHRWLPWILASGCSAAILALVHPDEGTASPAFALALALNFGFLALAASETIFPREAGLANQVRIWTPEVVQKLRWQLLCHAVLLAVAWLGVFSPLASALIDARVEELFGLIMVTALSINLFFIARLLRTARDLSAILSIGLIVLTVVALAGMIIYWFGFRNLGIYCLRVTFGTATLFTAFKLISAVLRESFDGLDSGRLGWQQKLRHTMHVETDREFPGSLWLRLTISILLWFALIIGVILIWGFGDTVVPAMRGFITDGIVVGNSRLVPIRILFGMLFFILVVVVSKRGARSFENRWSQRAFGDHAARQSLASVGVYVAVGVAAIIGLSIAGISMSSLAIVAGALSIGIGFGLQNVVNNFVSGIILLFERSVRRGDWVVVGNHEGYVKQVRVRSTIIETFDRSEVIVPNAELISSAVLNWTLTEQSGRLTVPVSVAYGTDVDEVDTVLREIASNNSHVISNSPRFNIHVFLIRFGDSSIDFELRCFLKNIAYRLVAANEINRAIVTAFKEHNIEIPYPRRDISILQSDTDLPDGNDPKAIRVSSADSEPPVREA